jgi:hypothetical protein
VPATVQTVQFVQRGDVGAGKDQVASWPVGLSSDPRLDGLLVRGGHLESIRPGCSRWSRDLPGRDGRSGRLISTVLGRLVGQHDEALALGLGEFDVETGLAQ